MTGRRSEASDTTVAPALWSRSTPDGTTPVGKRCPGEIYEVLG
jgi:hypothetical protein